MPEVKQGTLEDAEKYIARKKLGDFFSYSLKDKTFHSIMLDDGNSMMRLSIHQYPRGLDDGGIRLRTDRFIDEFFTVFNGYDMISWNDKYEKCDVIKLHVNEKLFQVRPRFNGPVFGAKVTELKEKKESQEFRRMKTAVEFILKQADAKLHGTPVYNFDKQFDKNASTSLWSCDIWQNDYGINTDDNVKEMWSFEYGDSFNDVLKKVCRREDCKMVVDKIGGLLGKLGNK